MTGVEFGFLMFGAMLVLLAIRVPIGIAMLLTGVTGYVTLTGWSPLLNYLKTVAYSRFSRVRPVGDPDVPADGSVREPRRAVAIAVQRGQRGDRPLARRRRDGGGRRLRRVRRDLRQLVGHRGDDGPGRASRVAPPQVRAGARHRHAGRRRHARHPDPAVDRAGRLRDPRGAEHREAVHGGVRARHPRRVRLHDRDRRLRAPEARLGTGRRTSHLARASVGAAGRLAGAAAVRGRHRRDLRRNLHADRGGGGRHRRHAGLRRLARRHALGRFARVPVRHGGGHRE